MKKLLIVLTVLALLCPVVIAENIDLSGMSFEELIDLRAAVDAAIWASDGWQEVDVPGGVYVIGEDIPAGRWSVASKSAIASFTLYPQKSDYTEKTYNYLVLQMLSEGESYTLECSEGNCLELSTSVTFTPFTGASLGFK